MYNKTLIRDFSGAVDRGDTLAVRTLWNKHPDMFQGSPLSIQSFLEDAATNDDVNMMKLLIELGADIHQPDGHGSPPAKEGVIVNAAGAGAINVVRWLLEHGAQLNFEYEEFPGESRCTPLTGAILGNHLEVVKLLVEQGGANINANWGNLTPLSYAIMYGKKEIEAYLRSKGALEPHQLPGTKPAKDDGDPLLTHIEEHLGKLKPLALQQVVSGSPAISIHVVPSVKNEKRQALVTAGMSATPMTVPAGEEEYQHAELVMFLPKDWPLTKKALKDPATSWPIDWLRTVARYPHECATWLGGQSCVIANGEPPEPLAPSVAFTCLLLLTEASEFSPWKHPDGRLIQFYTLFPIYTEERDLEAREGVVRLVERFQERGIDLVVNPKRPNVAKSKGKRA